MTTKQLTGNSVLIVGASGGLGSALAGELARRGARLALLARDISRLKALPVDGLRLAADIRNSEACRAAVGRVIEEHGSLDGVINAAGVVAFGPLVGTGDDVLEALFATDAVGPLRLLRAALPHMERGFIVNITAVVVEQPLPDMVAYCAAKGALATATAALRKELRKQRKDVLIVDARPPHTETGLAGRPIAGHAPKLPKGLNPRRVAERILMAVENGETEIPSDAFLKSSRGD
mgnify:CR=1 FL=1